MSLHKTKADYNFVFFKGVFYSQNFAKFQPEKYDFNL
jgi:hypothetical protein